MRYLSTLLVSVFVLGLAFGCSESPQSESNLAGISITCPQLPYPQACAPVQVYNLGHTGWWATAEYMDCSNPAPGQLQKQFSYDQPGGDRVMDPFCARVGSFLNIGPTGTATNASPGVIVWNAENWIKCENSIAFASCHH